MSKALAGFRRWFDALADAARAITDPTGYFAETERREREAAWNRVSALAGLTPDGSIAPPPPGITINRDAPRMWKTTYAANPPLVAITLPAGDLDLRPGAITYARVYRDLDDQAMCEIEGRQGDGRPEFLR